MSRHPQPVGQKGSLRWIQRAVNEKWASLEQPILDRLSPATSVEWKSPLTMDGHAEYRDADFLAALDLHHYISDLAEFWPQRGPQWDALGISNRGDILLVEAKAHIGEMCSPGTSAGDISRRLIADRLQQCADKLGATDKGALWPDHFYQLSNRLAHLDFLRSRGVSAYLVMVNFLNDPDVSGPATAEAWKAAYQVAFHVLGLGRKHPLSAFVVEIFPDVSVSS
jgi:hypothetical protein